MHLLVSTISFYNIHAMDSAHARWTRCDFVRHLVEYLISKKYFVRRKQKRQKKRKKSLESLMKNSFEDQGIGVARPPRYYWFHKYIAGTIITAPVTVTSEEIMQVKKLDVMVYSIISIILIYKASSEVYFSPRYYYHDVTKMWIMVPMDFCGWFAMAFWFSFLIVIYGRYKSHSQHNQVCILVFYMFIYCIYPEPQSETYRFLTGINSYKPMQEIIETNQTAGTRSLFVLPFGIKF